MLNDFHGFKTLMMNDFHGCKIDFLVYLENWKSCVEKSKGNFGRAERNKMFLSHQTYEGILIYVYSVIESVNFLLQVGMKFVLTERFNQDVAELWFLPLLLPVGYSTESAIRHHVL